MDLRSVANIVGYLLGILALAMLVPAAYELILSSPNWTSFVISSAITGFAGITLSLTTRTKTPIFSVRHAFVFTTVAEDFYWPACKVAFVMRHMGRKKCFITMHAPCKSWECKSSF